MILSVERIERLYPRASNEQIVARRAKLNKIRNIGMLPYSPAIARDCTAEQFVSRYQEKSRQQLAEQRGDKHCLAGRIKAIRTFGKAAFWQLQDESGTFQAFLSRDNLGEKFSPVKELIEVGDIVHLVGTAMKTKTGEVTLKVAEVSLLTKGLRPLPEKYHGVTDVDTRYRQRYVDLIMTDKSRETFLLRTKIIKAIRQFFHSKDFLEVETPMMHPIAGGALARPFKTRHNTLNRDLYLRIAPELYLKRLVVGGFERVFEINRSFRNEGMSIQHNPEFTMLEFYAAHTTYQEFMALTEELLTNLCQASGHQDLQLTYQGQKISFSAPFSRLTVQEAIAKYTELSLEVLDDAQQLADWLRTKDIANKDKIEKESLGCLLIRVFDNFVEQHLVQPTFVTDYPIEVSPLSRRNDSNPELAERFELFVAGREIANAFNELNDADDQYQRFCQQVLRRQQGDEEASGEVDLDYIRALEYGLPPTAGQGIGIDRLVMLFTDSPSIRDVILFPQLRAES